MDSSEMIPEDLVFYILLWLPVASLMRFKCVCKSWLSHIESPSFVSQHTRRDNQENKLIATGSGAKHMLLSVFNLELGKKASVKFNSGHNDAGVKLISSFDGLVCLAQQVSIRELIGNGGNKSRDSERAVVSVPRDLINMVSIINPVTRRTKVLKPTFDKLGLDTNIISHYGRIDYGFGYDIEMNDYKVVRVVIQELREDSDVLKSDVEVYSLKADSWRVINAEVPVKIWITSTTRRPSKNGVYYWLGRDFISKFPVILSFDFVHEVFDIIELGEVYEGYLEDELVLDFLREKLVFIHRVPWSYEMKCHCNVWVWEESWMKLYTIMLEPRLYPIGFAADGMMVLREERHDKEEKLVLCDLVSKDFSYTPFRGSFSDLVIFKGSLMSVNGANG